MSAMLTWLFVTLPTWYRVRRWRRLSVLMSSEWRREVKAREHAPER